MGASGSADRRAPRSGPAPAASQSGGEVEDDPASVEALLGPRRDHLPGPAVDGAGVAHELGDRPVRAGGHRRGRVGAPDGAGEAGDLLAYGVAVALVFP